MKIKKFILSLMITDRQDFAMFAENEEEAKRKTISLFEREMAYDTCIVTKVREQNAS